MTGSLTYISFIKTASNEDQDQATKWQMIGPDVNPQENDR